MENLEDNLGKLIGRLGQSNFRERKSNNSIGAYAKGHFETRRRFVELAATGDILGYDKNEILAKLKDVSGKYARMYFLLLKTGHYWDSLPEDSSSKHIGVRLIEDEGRYFWVLNFIKI